MDNTLTTSFRGHIMHQPKLDHTKADKPFIKLFIRVKRLERKKDQDENWVLAPRHVTIPVFFYGNRAKYIEKYLVKGQKVIVDAVIESYIHKPEGTGERKSELFLIGRMIEAMETSERAVERQREWEESRTERMKKDGETKENEKYQAYLNQDDIDEEMFRNVSLYDITDEDIGF